jgi:hypothetical protein
MMISSVWLWFDVRIVGIEESEDSKGFLMWLGTYGKCKVCIGKRSFWV